MSNFEWRVTWSASSNISFRGASDWMPWDGDEETIEGVEEAASARPGRVSMSDAEEIFWESSGVEYVVEAREAGEEA